MKALRPALLVITSYSIHYTKLYEKAGDTIVVSEAPTAATKPSSVGMRLF